MFSKIYQYLPLSILQVEKEHFVTVLIEIHLFLPKQNNKIESICYSLKRTTK